jgi:asparagine synthase (glutamine-hydrolysing)
MFAFAVWDREHELLTLARDRLGEKPLFYGWQQGVFLFGSELKSLRRHPAFSGAVDRDVLSLYLRHAYVPAPHSIHAGIYKLLPGSYLQLKPDAGAGSADQPVRYWSLRDVVERGLADPFPDEPDLAVEELERRLSQAISLQRIADVPLGAFLSGGLDSSLVVALMQAQSDEPVRTFTIGFGEEGYDESPDARAVADHLGTAHTELKVTPDEAMHVIPRLATIYDEPFSDESAIPTVLVSELARRSVTVSLSGDAGDELFGGYRRYLRNGRIWDRMSRMPYGLRKLAGAAIGALPVDALADATVRSGLTRRPTFALRAHSLRRRLLARTLDELYVAQLSKWHDPARDVVVGAQQEAVVPWMGELPADAHLEPLQHMSFLDTLGYLPDDILVKVDRAAMSTSLETRVPFLDHRVVEFAWSLPAHFKVRDGESKWLVRRVLERHLPSSLIDRPKKGFSVPIREWLRGPLRAWAEAALDPDRLARDGFFRPETVDAVWREHLSGRFDWQRRIWTILMFQSWLDASHDEASRPPGP